jgi:hypothetical protein
MQHYIPRRPNVLGPSCPAAPETDFRRGSTACPASQASSSYRIRCGRRRGGWWVATYEFHRPNQHLFMHVIGGGRRDVSSLLRFPHALPLILPHATALTRTTAPSRQSPPLPHFPLLFFVTHLAIKAWPPHGVPSQTRLYHHLTTVIGVSSTYLAILRQRRRMACSSWPSSGIGSLTSMHVPSLRPPPTSSVVT